MNTNPIAVGITPPPPMSQTELEVNRLAEAVEHLGSLLHSLEDKTAPVLIPLPMTGGAQSLAPTPGEAILVPLASGIRSSRYRIETFCVNLESLISRIEL